MYLALVPWSKSQLPANKPFIYGGFTGGCHVTYGRVVCIPMQESVVLFRKLLEQTQAAEAAGDPDAPAAVKMFASGLDYAIAHEQVVEQWVSIR